MGPRAEASWHLIVNFEDGWYVVKMRAFFWSVPAVWLPASFLMLPPPSSALASQKLCQVHRAHLYQLQWVHLSLCHS